MRAGRHPPAIPKLTGLQSDGDKIPQRCSRQTRPPTRYESSSSNALSHVSITRQCNGIEAMLGALFSHPIHCYRLRLRGWNPARYLLQRYMPIRERMRRICVWFPSTPSTHGRDRYIRRRHAPSAQASRIKKPPLRNGGLGSAMFAQVPTCRGRGLPRRRRRRSWGAAAGSKPGSSG